jgi:RimJ/RimL family protein N-acetyltransferase
VPLPALTTARLRLRPMSDADLPASIALNSDPEVMAYILGRPATPEETAAEWAERLGERTDVRRGLGYWAGFEHGAFVGWWGASAFARDRRLSSIGYRLARSAWGRGLATEGAVAMVLQARDAPGVERVVASTMVVNAASRRVLEKAGLTLVRTVVRQWDDPIDGWELGEAEYELP